MYGRQGSRPKGCEKNGGYAVLCSRFGIAGADRRSREQVEDLHEQRNVLAGIASLSRSRLFRSTSHHRRIKMLPPQKQSLKHIHYVCVTRKHYERDARVVKCARTHHTQLLYRKVVYILYGLCDRQIVSKSLNHENEWGKGARDSAGSRSWCIKINGVYNNTCGEYEEISSGSSRVNSFFFTQQPFAIKFLELSRCRIGHGFLWFNKTVQIMYSFSSKNQAVLEVKLIDSFENRRKIDFFFSMHIFFRRSVIFF